MKALAPEEYFLSISSEIPSFSAAYLAPGGMNPQDSRRTFEETAVTSG